ncbi:MAG: RNA-binding protein [Anaerolineales bacterium]|nr:RNA-binding protein [Anaerolineales bacterium]
MEVKLHVGNLALTTTADDLRVLFAQAGAVTATDVVKDRDTGGSRGFGFVTMASQADAQKAIAMLNAFVVSERALTVTTAKPREDRARPTFGNRGGAFGKGGGPARRPGRRGGARRY